MHARASVLAGAAVALVVSLATVVVVSRADASADALGADLGVAASVTPGVIRTVVGTGAPCASPTSRCGDWGPALASNLARPGGITLDEKAGAAYVADTDDRRVRRIGPFGNITTVVGTGGAFCMPLPDTCGDGGPASLARLGGPGSVTLDSFGNMYVVDTSSARIRKVDATGQISTVVGTGQSCWPTTDACGDGGPATAASMGSPTAVVFNPQGEMFIADGGVGRIRKVDRAGRISTVAGTGESCIQGTLPCGDGGPATAAQLSTPWGLVFSPEGDLLIADTFNDRIRRVDAAGVISTVIGTGVTCTTSRGCGDLGPASSAQLNGPWALANDANGNLYITEARGNRIRQVNKRSGIIRTVAGNGTACTTPTDPCGDGGPAISASLTGPLGMALDSAGNIYVADTDVNRIRRIDAPPEPGSYFHALAPTRLLDSRNQTGGWNHPLGPGAANSTPLLVTGATVPASAEAVILNVTVTGATTGSFVTVYPDGAPAPQSSSINFAPGQTVANQVTVPVGAAGQIRFMNNAGTVDVVVDVEGYYDQLPGDRYTPRPTTRLLDSRTTLGGWSAPLGAGPTNVRSLQVGGVANVPAGASAVTFNVTITGATTPSFVSVYPTGSAVPATSSINFAGGAPIANLVTTKLGAGGAVNFYNNTGTTNVVVDLAGYYDSTGTGLFHPIAPTRVLDSRTGLGGWNTPLGAGLANKRPLQLNPTVPAPTAVVINATVTNPTAPSFLALFANNQTYNGTSNVNFSTGQTVANAAVVPLDSTNQIQFLNAQGSTDVIADISGYFS